MSALGARVARVRGIADAMLPPQPAMAAAQRMNGSVRTNRRAWVMAAKCIFAQKAACARAGRTSKHEDVRHADVERDRGLRSKNVKADIVGTFWNPRSGAPLQTSTSSLRWPASTAARILRAVHEKNCAQDCLRRGPAGGTRLVKHQRDRHRRRRGRAHGRASGSDSCRLSRPSPHPVAPQERQQFPSPVHASRAIVPLVHSRPCVFRKHPLSLQDCGALKRSCRAPGGDPGVATHLA